MTEWRPTSTSFTANPYANDQPRLVFTPARIATNYFAATCTSLHLSLASLQLNCAVFPGLSDPFTATSLSTLRMPIIAHPHYTVALPVCPYSQTSVTALALLRLRLVANAFYCQIGW